MCLVMKRYSRSLTEKIAAGEMDDIQVRRIAQKLCRTLRQLHVVGVAVQDIKPENVLLDEYDEPVFADFGISGECGNDNHVFP